MDFTNASHLVGLEIFRYLHACAFTIRSPESYYRDLHFRSGEETTASRLKNEIDRKLSYTRAF